MIAIISRFLKTPLVFLAGIFLSLGLIWALISYRSVSLSRFEEETKVVEAQAACIEDIHYCVSLIGVLKPKQITVLTAGASGVLTLHVAPGEPVAKGTLLASIDDKDDQTKFELATSIEGIARDQYERALALHEAMSLSKQGLEEKKSAWINAQQTLYEAKSNWKNLKLFAPFEGIVGSFNLNEGSSVQSGDKIAVFYDPSSVRLYLDVPSSILPFIHQGSQIQVGTKRYPLTYVEKMIHEETHMASAYLDLSSQDSLGSFLMGTSLKVEVSVQEKENVIVVPFESVFFRKGETFIYIIEEREIISRPVTLGLRYREKVEVVTGIEKGDILVIRGQERLYPGLKVDVLRVDQNF